MNERSYTSTPHICLHSVRREHVLGVKKIKGMRDTVVRNKFEDFYTRRSWFFTKENQESRILSGWFEI